MKRTIMAFVAAATLALPVGASAETSALDAEALRAACPTPIQQCVQEQIDYAFELGHTALDVAKYYVEYLLRDCPPGGSCGNICYLVWGQPCSTTDAPARRE